VANFGATNIEEPTSSVGVKFGYVSGFEEDSKSLGLSGILVTDIGGFKFDAEKREGDRRINPHRSNPVANGTQPDDLYDKESGDASKLSVGYKAILNNSDNKLTIGAGLALGKGDTDNGSSVPGYMSQEGYGIQAGVSWNNINTKAGISATLAYANREENSTFYEGSVSEDLKDVNINLTADSPKFSNYNIGAILNIINSTSDVNNFDVAPGNIAVDRKVDAKEYKYGIIGRIFEQDNLDTYWSLGIGSFTGKERHEYASAGVKGVWGRLEKSLNQDSKIWFEGYRKTSDSDTDYPGFYPQYGPIDLKFSQENKKQGLELGFTNSDITAALKYDENKIKGSTNVAIKALGATIPFTSEDIKDKVLSLELSKKIGENITASINASSNFGEYEEDIFIVGLDYKF